MSTLFKRHKNVYLYIPNLIGYARIACALYAFSVASSKPLNCVLFYFFGFICDELDGRFARKFNQTSTLGAVLDMVTDRVATSCLLALLCIVYPRALLIFVSLLMLDIFSHWFQMYSTLLAGSSTHKDVKSRSWLVRTYYKHRLFMGFCCVCCEVLYLSLYLLSWQQYRQWVVLQLPAVLRQLVQLLPGAETLLLGGGLPVIAVLAAAALPGTVIKQVCNWVQLTNAAQGLVDYDLRRMQ